MAHNSVTCPSCGVEETPDDERPLPPLHEIGEFRCEACGSRFIYGKLVPRIVVEPVDERGVRWTRIRFQDPKTKEDVHVVDIDQKLAVLFAKNVLSITLP
jgi:hypothetical protein